MATSAPFPASHVSVPSTPVQVHGSRLRLAEVSPADSGEYVCRVESESGAKEASIIISVLHSTHSGPSYTPGEEPGGAGWGLSPGISPVFPGKVPVVSSVTSGQKGALWAGFAPLLPH